jgi:trigger factor
VRVNVERLPGSTVELDIAADEAEFEVAVDQAFKKIAREVTLPGFRRGKAPRNLIEKMVGRDAIVQEAGQDMMDDLFRQAIEQENLVPVGDPRVGITQADPLAFKVVIEVFPTIEVGDYRSVRVEPREVELEESEVQEVIDQLQRQHSEWVDPAESRAPRDDDQITMDIQVFEGEDEFQEPAEDATFVIGETPLFESLVEAIKMMQVGTTAELTLAFDEDDESVAPELRGKDLRYVVTLKGIKERARPELDDELAKKVGEQYETFAQLREQIEKDLLRNKTMSARGEVATEVINAMAEQSTLDVPSSMVEREIEDELTQFRSRLAQQRLTLDEYLDSNDQSEAELRDEIRPNAERRVRNSLVLQEIAKAENVEVTDEDIMGEINRLSAPAANPERLREMYQSDYFRGLLENEMMDRKLTDTVINIATEGRGPVTGAGARLLEEDAAAPIEAAAQTSDETTAEEAEVEESALPAAQAESTEPELTDGSVMAAEAIEAEAASEPAAGDEAEEETEQDSAATVERE